MATSSSSLRLFCSLPNLLVFSLNLLLLLISTASFIPLLLLRTPPSSFGWALLAVSSTTLFSSLLSFFHLTHSKSNLYFIIHLSLLLISSIGQTLSFFSLFLRPGPCLTFLGSSKSNREVRLLVMIEEAAIVGMFVLSSVALVLECFVQSWRVKEYEEEEVANAKKRNRRMGKFRVESVVDVEAQEEEERMKIKREEGVKTGHYRIAKF